MANKEMLCIVKKCVGTEYCLFEIKHADDFEIKWERAMTVREAIKKVDRLIDVTAVIIEDAKEKDEEAINGIELDFKDFIDSFAERWNRLVELKALKILEEKYNSMLKSIYDIQEELEYQHNKICGYEED